MGTRSHHVSLVVCRTTNNNIKLQAILIDEFGISLGHQISCTDYEVWYPRIIFSAPNKIIISHNKTSDGNKLYLLIGSISGDIIAIESIIRCTDYATDEPYVKLLTDNTLLLACRNVSNNKLLLQIISN